MLVTMVVTTETGFCLCCNRWGPETRSPAGACEEKEAILGGKWKLSLLYLRPP